MATCQCKLPTFYQFSRVKYSKRTFSYFVRTVSCTFFLCRLRDSKVKEHMRKTSTEYKLEASQPTIVKKAGSPYITLQNSKNFTLKNFYRLKICICVYVALLCVLFSYTYHFFREENDFFTQKIVRQSQNIYFVKTN